MNFELFIARRIHFSKNKGEKRASAPAIKIAIAGVAIGLAAMIIALAVVIGFKKEVRGKVVGFGSHIQVTNLQNSSAYETLPVCVDAQLFDALRKIDNIKHVQVFSTKPGIIKTDSAFQGVVLKGVGQDYDWDFFKQNLIEGSIVNPADTVNINQAILSKDIANKLGLKTGDNFICYFIGDNNVRMRKFYISGIYRTNFEDYDNLFVITDIDLIRKLNNWEEDEVSGIELLVTDYDKLDEIQADVFQKMIYHQDRKENRLLARSIKDVNPMIFSWLDLLDTHKPPLSKGRRWYWRRDTRRGIFTRFCTVAAWPWRPSPLRWGCASSILNNSSTKSSTIPPTGGANTFLRRRTSLSVRRVAAESTRSVCVRAGSLYLL